MSRGALLRTILGVALCFVLAFALGACATTSETEEEYEPGYDEGTIATEVSTLPPIKIAALESDDLLPLKVAQTEGLLEIRGLVVEVLIFEAVEEKHAAFSDARVDALISDMVDLALLSNDDLTVYAVAVTQNLTDEQINASSEATNTLHGTLFEIPDEFVSQRVLAFSHDFLLGNTASGEDTAPEASAEAINTLIGALAQAVGQVNTASHAYVDLYLEQGVAAQYLYDEPTLPTYPFPEIPDREEGEALLRWLLENDKLQRAINYDDLIFVPIAP
ncbi:MAG: hypothetical protein FWC99_02610 [Coriobacteriia bacterium]|nr:hypothetical protein [Coriobacteriia bacterium]